MSTAEFHDDETDLDEGEEEIDEDPELEEIPDLDDDDIAIDDAPVAGDDIADVDDPASDDDDADDDDADDDDADDDETAEHDAAEDDDEDDDAEESLDVLLAREKVLDADDLGRIADESRDGLTIRPALVSEGEFTCRSCFLVKRRAQLADPKRTLCFDCA